jgi:hypothetical protein
MLRSIAGHCFRITGIGLACSWRLYVRIPSDSPAVYLPFALL